ncbi:TFIIS_M domain-containing protein/SPOC domain-containing protein [Cephalotus follicularis]|uniref:TFIIS_M domain-containing protein/SPOC domain-containing protein n=1 Tax=Cephalotus follicularis TaxID=3775 RepID=A0A1Q3C3L6_CEPFO|nr:TFIIS_M domain-containing protein/SPOC domain-containing protein [Cephalotus follicularis]
MSNNLVSQPLTILSNQISQLEPISSRLDSSTKMGSGNNNISPQQFSISSVQMGSLGSVSTDLASQQLSIPIIDIGYKGSESINPGLQFSMSKMHMGQTEVPAYNSVAHHKLLRNKQSGEMGTMSNDVELQQLSMSSKRKAPMESFSSNFALQKLSLPNKRVSQMEHRPWLQQISPPNKRSVQPLPLSNTHGSQNLQTANKKVVRNESIPKKSGSAPRSHTAQTQPSPRTQTDSSESVRSKMRESLAAALDLVSQLQDKSQPLEKGSDSEASGTQLIGSASAAAFSPVSREPKGTLPSDEHSAAQMCTDGQSSSLEAFVDGSTIDSTPMPICDGLEFHSSFVLPDEDVSFSDSFFAKDELLQGNGLSWVLDPVTEVAEKQGFRTAEQQHLDHQEGGGDRREQGVKSPQILALEIEAELFKLFGGVNKKYKEKGRSLLFNLKDRNNPELRERVVSGDIPPDRLCSMTAEELASEELSQWRMAKAEELAQMVVLPDSEVDVRRLVKKTHKGEVQVEVGQQDSVLMDISVGSGSFTPTLPKKEKEEASLPKPDGIKAKDDAASEKNNLKKEVFTIPSSEGNDLMQGLMVDDALKDAEFLPPIVSLDEFMESLTAEPPFENLPLDAGSLTPIKDKDHSEIGLKSKAPDVTPDDHVDSAPNDPSNTDVAISGAEVTSIESPVKSETTPPVGTFKGEHVWEGLLQLNISAVITVIGIFKSGEKTSAKEWPLLLEIKGRVRLEAFEKFLQELKMSRSRAIMVVHLVCKDVSAESERASLREVADSYVLDGRVGLAEPAPGMELYLCPPHAKTLDMLTKVLAKDQIDAVNAIDNGLIGVIVWRKAQTTSTMSPNSTSLHKHTSKKQHFTSRRHYEKDTNVNANLISQHPMPHTGIHTHTKPLPQDDDDDDDDVPPGFGPGAVRDDDDLPEFNFSGGSTMPTRNQSRGPRMAPYRSHSQATSRPVDQMRELVQKYGQPNASASSGSWQDKRGTGVPVQPWDDDDDDDIPEWQPQASQLQRVDPSALVHDVQQPMLRVHMANHAQQPPVSVMQGQHQGSWWAPPHQPGGQFYASPGLGAVRPGLSWRQDAPKSRGF